MNRELKLSYFLLISFMVFRYSLNCIQTNQLKVKF